MDVRAHTAALKRRGEPCADAPGTPNLHTLFRHHGRPGSLRRGERLYHAAEPGQAIHVIVNGMIKESIVTSGGSEQVVQVYFESDVLGLSSLSTARHGCTASALEPTRTRSLPGTVLTEACRRHPWLQDELLQLMSASIAELQSHGFAMTKSALGRTADFLLVLAARRRLSDGALSLPMSLYEVGCYLGIALETVSRSLSELERMGVITKLGATIRFHDWDRLRHIADAGRVAAE